MDSRNITVLAVTAALVLPTASVSRPGGQGLDPVPSPAASMVRSAVVPGWGEFGLERPRRGRLFTEVEVVLWVALIQAGQTSRRYDSQLKSFGTLHAGASFSGRDDQFVTDVGNFMSLDAFNQAQQRLRQQDRVYRDREKYAWSWDSDRHRITYRRFRVRRDTARKIGRFIIGGMVLNRIVSVIDVAYLHRIGPAGSKVKLYPHVDPGTGTAGLRASVRL